MDSIISTDLHTAYGRVGQALERLADRFPDQPGLSELAADAGLSEFHFQRLFSDWVGVSPKKFLQHLTIEAAKRRLEESASVLDAAYDAGLSGPGRLHDLFVNIEAVTPGEYKARGRGVTLRYGFHDSPFGECLLMATERGLCGLGFVTAAGRDAALADLLRVWENAVVLHEPDATAPYAARLFDPRPASRTRDAAPLRLLLRGSPFQIKIWRALLAMPPGTLTTYADLARRIGLPAGAARAVGTANGANAISWLIPCHRVIRKTGAMGGYRWGEARKLAMIGWEAVRSAAESQPLAGQGSIPPQPMNAGFSKPGLP